MQSAANHIQHSEKRTSSQDTLKALPRTEPPNSKRRPPPLSLDQIRRLVRHAPDEAVVGEIRDRGTNFKSDLAAVDELTLIGAGPLTIELLRSLITNRPPTVILYASAAEIEQGEYLKLFANADDPDDDDLEYYWSSTAGTIEGNGRETRLNTSRVPVDSDSTTLTVTVTASDRKGGMDSKSIIVVLRRQAPVKTWRVGEYIMVALSGRYSDIEGRKGSIELELRLDGYATDATFVAGSLPGLPCSIDLVPRGDNIAKYSIVEQPKAENDWNRLTLRILPRDMTQPIGFAVDWRLVQGPLTVDR